MIDELEQQLWAILEDMYKCSTNTMPHSEQMVQIMVPVRTIESIRRQVPEKKKRILKLEGRS